MHKALNLFKKISQFRLVGPIEIQTLKYINQCDDIIDLYVDYYHLDED